MAEKRASSGGDWKRNLGDREQRALEQFEKRHGEFGGRERRHGIPVTARTAASGDPDVAYTVKGHAAVYNRKSLDLGGFVEIIEPGFFDDVLSRSPDAHLLWDHNTMFALARTTSSKYLLELKASDQGMQFFAKVAPTSFAADLRVLMEGEVIDQASFAFTVAEDAWEVKNRGKPGEYVLRRLIRCEDLFDATICAQGAYPAADSQVVRSAAVAFARSTGRLGDEEAPTPPEDMPDIDPHTPDADAPGVNREAPDSERRVPASRPIADASDLRAAIRELDAEPSRDLDRADLITRAKELQVPALIPANWQPDGAFHDERAWSTAEKRETYNDLYEGLDAAVDDALVLNGGFYYCWVRDFDDTNVYFSAGGDLYAAPYTVTDGPIEIGDPVKVRPITEYVETERSNGEGEQRTVDVKAAKLQAKLDMDAAKGDFLRTGRRFKQD